MSSPAVLSLLQEGDSCQFMWQPAGSRPGAAILLAREPRSPEADRAQRAELDRAARLLGQRILRPHAAASASDSTAIDPLFRIARLIYNRLPPAVMQALAELPPGASLLIDASAGELSWELAHDGEDYLALKVAVARRFLLAHPPRQNPLPPRRQFTALIIGNPTGDLPHADREVEELVRLLQATPGTAPPRILMRRRATRSAVLGELASGAYDLVHYSGHAFFDPATPEGGGLILAPNEVLTGAEIEKNLGGRPFVFLNGCETARQQVDAASVDDPAGLAYLGQNAAGLASAFVQGGAAGGHRHPLAGGRPQRARVRPLLLPGGAARDAGGGSNASGAAGRRARLTPRIRCGPPLPSTATPTRHCWPRHGSNAGLHPCWPLACWASRRCGGSRIARKKVQKVPGTFEVPGTWGGTWGVPARRSWASWRSRSRRWPG